MFTVMSMLSADVDGEVSEEMEFNGAAILKEEVCMRDVLVERLRSRPNMLIKRGDE